MPSFRFEVDFFSLAYTRALLSHAPCPAPLRHAGARAHVWHTCGPRTHARRSSLPAGVAWRPRSASSCRRPGRPGFPARRPRLPRRRPPSPPLLAPWPPLPVAFGSPPSDSQRWAFSEPPVPFPRPRPARRPRTRVPGPHAQPRLSHAPPPAVWRLSQRTNVALLHLTPEVAS